MRGEQIEKMLTRMTVDYCAYGKPYRKATDLWTSFEWMPKGSTGNGRCNNGQCGMGEESKAGRFKHKVVIAGENARRLGGKHQKKQLWSLPKTLTEELLCAVQEKQQSAVSDSQSTVPVTEQCPTTQRVVIDLFSGGESWREVVESKGFRYIPVDIRPLCTGGKSR